MKGLLDRDEQTLKKVIIKCFEFSDSWRVHQRDHWKSALTENKKNSDPSNVESNKKRD